MNEPTHHPDDELLSAYLDGELPREQADRVTDRLAAEPDLLRRLEALRSGDEAVRAAFADLDEVPLPDEVRALVAPSEPESAPTSAGVRSGGDVVPFPVRVARSLWQPPVAIAASVALVAGLFMAGLLERGTAPESGDLPWTPGPIETSSPLHALLESHPAGAGMPLSHNATGAVRLTWRGRDGSYCRHVVVDRPGEKLEAVACRRDGAWEWRVASLVPAARGDSGQTYLPASGGADPAIRAAISGTIGEDPPLDAAGEDALIGSGWEAD